MESQNLSFKVIAKGLLALSLILLVLCLAVGAVVLVLFLAKDRLGIEASALVALVAGGFAWLIKSSLENRREHRRLIARDKWEHYVEFLDFIRDFIQNPSENLDKSSPRIQKLIAWNMKLLMIGSPEVVKAWGKFRNLPFSDMGDNAGASAMISIADLIQAMRKDCGQTGAISRKDILSVFINDLDKQPGLFSGD